MTAHSSPFLPPPGGIAIRRVCLLVHLFVRWCDRSLVRIRRPAAMAGGRRAGVRRFLQARAIARVWRRWHPIRALFLVFYLLTMFHDSTDVWPLIDQVTSDWPVVKPQGGHGVVAAVMISALGHSLLVSSKHEISFSPFTLLMFWVSDTWVIGQRPWFIGHRSQAVDLL